MPPFYTMKNGRTLHCGCPAFFFNQIARKCARNKRKAAVFLTDFTDNADVARVCRDDNAPGGADCTDNTD